ncbi:nicotinate (nicotinamide) nucleotide adenylyltransferase [Candidatus Riflebacteria bacterium]
MKKILNRSDVAQIFGISVRTLQNWQKKKILSPDLKGKDRQAHSFSRDYINSIRKGRVITEEQKKTRVGLYGGSFSPFHIGHLLSSLEIMAMSTLDEIWFLPCYQHRWKYNLLPPEKRLEMLRIVCEDYPFLNICDLEIDLAIKGETIKLIKKLQPHYGPDYRFFFIIGSDVAQQYHRWTGVEELTSLISFIIIHRIGFPFDRPDSPLKGKNHQYLHTNMAISNVSGTLIRKRLLQGHDIAHLLPAKIWNYIQNNSLYLKK